ncbi:hypothetical protein Clacol_009369 [Clathrus columnatus]|uniref:RING-type domain-containing protein n=1 Tax=Clathrus columnatus TaxID=1419009 RepID=A0AAV5APK3_9AGAM|nr:hypothetical protein Clacol_009369 [Clathrus columnatus]
MIFHNYNCEADLHEGTSLQVSPFKFGANQLEIPIPEASNNEDNTSESANLSPEEAEQMIEELEDMVKDLEKRSARVEEETIERTKSLEGMLKECMICFDVPRNPQILECGHSACYSCLRLWWTRASDNAFGDPIISTDDEDNSDGEVTRYRFHLAVNKKKKCPECKRDLTQRPVPSSIPTIPPLDQRRTTHKDLWRGIFPEHKEGQSSNVRAHGLPQEERSDSSPNPGKKKYRFVGSLKRGRQ